MKFLPTFRTLLKGWLVSFICWGCVAAVMMLRSFMLGRGSLAPDIVAALRDWLPWAILTPLLFGLVARVPIMRRNWRFRTVLHACCAILIVAAVHFWKDLVDPSLHGASHSRWHEHAFGEGPPPGDFFRPPPPGSPQGHPPPSHSDLLFALSFEFPIYLMIISAAHTLYFYRRGEIRKGQLAAAHLQTLQSRLQPHFLFNTLNTIAGLVHKSPDKAEMVLTMLSDLLRLSLESTSATQVTLEHELNFVQKYLGIMQVRYERRVQYELEIAPDTLAACVPTLLLQPIVENAIKYGIEPNPDGGKVTIRTWRSGDSLCVNVSNTDSALPRSKIFAEGLGISNTRERLREFFGNAASLTLDNRDDVTIAIVVPFRTCK
jgi:two-component system LytT family sensor kinase